MSALQCRTCYAEPADTLTALNYDGGLCACGGELWCPGFDVTTIGKVRAGRMFLALGDQNWYRRTRTESNGVAHVKRADTDEPNLFCDTAHCLVPAEGA